MPYSGESSLGLGRERKYGKLKLRNEMPYSQGVKSELDRKGYGNLDLGMIQNAVGRSVCRWSVEKYGKLKLKLKCCRKIGLLVVGREVRQIGSVVKNAI